MYFFLWKSPECGNEVFPSFERAPPSNFEIPHQHLDLGPRTPTSARRQTSVVPGRPVRRCDGILTAWSPRALRSSRLAHSVWGRPLAPSGSAGCWGPGHVWGKRTSSWIWSRLPRTSVRETGRACVRQRERQPPARRADPTPGSCCCSHHPGGPFCSRSDAQGLRDTPDGSRGVFSLASLQPRGPLQPTPPSLFRGRGVGGA